MSNWKRVVAREWLTFLACLVLILCFGLVATVAGADMDDKAWEAVLASGVWLWIFVLFVRSVVWSFKQVRRKAA
jgi:hypothetical protein